MKTEFKGTKGKWFACCLYGNSKPHFLFSEHGETVICSFTQKQEMGKDLTIEEVQANAKLIASAPDLLEALMNIENDNGSIPKAIWDMRNKAIEKALN